MTLNEAALGFTPNYIPNIIIYRKELTRLLEFNFPAYRISITDSIALTAMNVKFYYNRR